MNAPGHPHIVASFDGEIARLVREIAVMGELAVAQLEAAVDALLKRDGRAARRVVDNDDVLDARESEISHDVLRLLALRQPIARDLREVLAALRIASDIERIGDHAENVARRSLMVDVSAPVPLSAGLQALAVAAATIVRSVLRAYVGQDAPGARTAREADAELDALYDGLFRQLLACMMEDPSSIGTCTHLLFVAKHLERIGDHATNIAEEVWFAVRGEPLKALRKRDECGSLRVTDR